MLQPATSGLYLQAMTARSFRYLLLATTAAMLIASLMTLIVGKMFEFSEEARAMIPTYIAAGAAAVAFGAQRRIAHTNALRSLWERIVRTAQEAIAFAENPDASWQDAGRLRAELSARIEEVRAVFRNCDQQYIPPDDVAKAYVVGVKAALRDATSAGRS